MKSLLLLAITCPFGHPWAAPRTRADRPAASRTTKLFLARSRSPPPIIPADLRRSIREVAEELWSEEGGIPAAADAAEREKGEGGSPISGEAPYPAETGRSYADRTSYFEKLANDGDPRAQHSLGLLLWSGYGGCHVDPESSARWHAAAAAQDHLDGVAVLGGCLRTGTGVGKAKDVALGLKLIECAAERRNPTGINKRAALEEANGNFEEAYRMYSECWRRGNGNGDGGRGRCVPNALLLMNLGWCHVHGEGTTKDVPRGEDLWRRAAGMAPDEGSEEAAWLLYLQYKRDDPKEARQWLELAADLGFDEAVEEMN